MHIRPSLPPLQTQIPALFPFISFSSDSGLFFFFFFASSVSKSTSTLPESHWNSVENDDQKRSKSVSLSLLSSWPKAGQIHNHSRRRSSPSPAVLGSNVLSTEKNIKKTPCRGVTNLYQGNRNFGSSPGWTC